MESVYDLIRLSLQLLAGINPTTSLNGPTVGGRDGTCGTRQTSPRAALDRPCASQGAWRVEGGTQVSFTQFTVTGSLRNQGGGRCWRTPMECSQFIRVAKVA